MNLGSSVDIITEWDIVAARQLGRNEAKAVDLVTDNQARITTAISELARNIYLYAGKGKIEIRNENPNNHYYQFVIASDKGPGILDIRKVMEDGYTTSGGLGAGLPGVKRLMDDFKIETVLGEGTTISASKLLR